MAEALAAHVGIPLRVFRGANYSILGPAGQRRYHKSSCATTSP